MRKPLDDATFIANVLQMDMQIDFWKKRREAYIEHYQQNCPHPIGEVIEGYTKYEYMGQSPPVRVCCRCGLGEVGWGCGYRRLHRNVYGREEIRQVSETEALNLCKTLYENDGKVRWRR